MKIMMIDEYGIVQGEYKFIDYENNVADLLTHLKVDMELMIKMAEAKQ